MWRPAVKEALTPVQRVSTGAIAFRHSSDSPAALPSNDATKSTVTCRSVGMLRFGAVVRYCYRQLGYRPQLLWASVSRRLPGGGRSSLSVFDSLAFDAADVRCPRCAGSCTVLPPPASCSLVVPCAPACSIVSPPPPRPAPPPPQPARRPASSYEAVGANFNIRLAHGGRCPRDKRPSC